MKIVISRPSPILSSSMLKLPANAAHLARYIKQDCHRSGSSTGSGRCRPIKASQDYLDHISLGRLQLRAGSGQENTQTDKCLYQGYASWANRRDRETWAPKRKISLGFGLVELITQIGWFTAFTESLWYWLHAGITTNNSFFFETRIIKRFWFWPESGV